MRESLKAEEWDRIRAYLVAKTVEEARKKASAIGGLEKHLSQIASDKSGGVQPLATSLVEEAMKWCKKS